MTVQPVRYFGDPVLRERATEVTTFDKELRTLVADLQETMVEQGGAGLAAPQIGVGLRAFVFRATGLEGELVEGHMINPEWTVLDDTEQIGPEGCLSIPGFRWDCRRYDHVVARGWDLHGEPQEIEGTSMLARAIQHETDHLDGVLFLDKLDAATRKEAMAAIRQADWFDPAAPPRVKASPHAPAGAGAGPVNPLFGGVRTS
ncbi:peptide deformylase [Actinomycetospora sp.]|uniref:peptide deformylase n=1 Tax=Actinomycetospora sp. TaxID=1872135 RepID=UPI002F419DE4